MTLRNFLIAVVLIATTSFAYAHGPKVGANGGPQADAGSFHVEVVPSPSGVTHLLFWRR